MADDNTMSGGSQFGGRYNAPSTFLGSSTSSAPSRSSRGSAGDSGDSGDSLGARSPDGGSSDSKGCGGPFSDFVRVTLLSQGSLAVRVARQDCPV